MIFPGGEKQLIERLMESTRESIAVTSALWQQRDAAWRFIRELANEDGDGAPQEKARLFLISIGQEGEIRPALRRKATS